MLKFIGCVGAVIAITGCSGLELARLAPPGIIRYERIADEKEPNPTIAAQVAARGEAEKPEFPKLGETAAGAAEMTAIPNKRVARQVTQLESDRDNLNVAVETDMLESSAAVQETQDMETAAKDLSETIDAEKKAAALERRDADMRNESDEN